jgi:thiosulfate sulfurtransferase
MEEPIKTITVAQAKDKIADGDTVFIDIRDPDSYATAHVPGAIQINDTNVEAFVAGSDKSRTHIVYCYHGITSQGGAAFFQENGFQDVYSMEGGFCAWE